MRVVLFSLLVAVAGCTTSGIPVSAVATDPTTVEAPWLYIMELGANNRIQPTRHEVPGTPDEVWPRLVQAYGALDIGIAQADTTTYLVGNPNMALPTRELAGQRLSRSLDCGRTPTGIPAAERHSVSLQIFTQLVPTADGTEVRSIVTGRALNPTSNDPAVRCVSTGYIEGRIAHALMGIS